MPRMPGAIWQGEHGSLSMQRYDIVCVHTIVGFAPAHAAHFSTKADGTIIQSRDTKFQSGANLEGNPRVIAIENEDHGSAFGSWDINDGHAVPAMTAAQVTANAKILRWVHDTHGVPLQLCADSKAGSRGLAYHRQGIDGDFSSYDYPGRVPGGEIWTKTPGKVCPGDRRIDQVPKILSQADDGDDMPLNEDDKTIIRNILRQEFYGDDKAHTKGLTQIVRCEVRAVVEEMLTEAGSTTRVELRSLAKLGSEDAAPTVAKAVADEINT